jgi:cytochrome o ubiquinol oxidase subunit 1
VFSEVISTFSSKQLFGYTSMVYATICITILSFVVWLHHFFTMGSGADVNAFFGITTMIISIPTGAKIFNWLFTMYRGRVRFTTPVLWTVGFMITFTIGGMSGVLMAVPPADYVLHNSLFLIAHFHNVIIGGVVFGCMAGFTYWFPKATGFKLDERLGKVSFWCWFIGFYIAFMPLYVLGLMGMTRRLDHLNNPVWHVYLVVAMCGALLIMCGIAAQLAQIALSIRNRAALRDLTGDPWNARTLEWSIASPAPAYNFARMPLVTSRDAYWEMKRKGVAHRQFSTYRPIHMPRNTGTGVIISAFAAAMGFALIWHIWWLAIVSFAAAIATAIAHTFNEDRDYYVSPDEVARTEDAHLDQIASQA